MRRCAEILAEKNWHKSVSDSKSDASDADDEDEKEDGWVAENHLEVLLHRLVHSWVNFEVHLPQDDHDTYQIQDVRHVEIQTVVNFLGLQKDYSNQSGQLQCCCHILISFFYLARWCSHQKPTEGRSYGLKY